MQCKCLYSFLFLIPWALCFVTFNLAAFPAVKSPIKASVPDSFDSLCRVLPSQCKGFPNHTQNLYLSNLLQTECFIETKYKSLGCMTEVKKSLNSINEKDKLYKETIKMLLK